MWTAAAVDETINELSRSWSRDVKETGCFISCSLIYTSDNVASCGYGINALIREYRFRGMQIGQPAARLHSVIDKNASDECYTVYKQTRSNDALAVVRVRYEDRFCYFFFMECFRRSDRAFQEGSSVEGTTSFSLILFRSNDMLRDNIWYLIVSRLYYNFFRPLKLHCNAFCVSHRVHFGATVSSLRESCNRFVVKYF